MCVKIRGGKGKKTDRPAVHWRLGGVCFVLLARFGQGGQFEPRLTLGLPQLLLLLPGKSAPCSVLRGWLSVGPPVMVK